MAERELFGESSLNSNKYVDPLNTPSATIEVKPLIEKGQSEFKKQTFFERIGRIFIAGDFKSAREYVLTKVLEPAAREVFYKAVTGFADSFIRGNTKSTTVKPETRSYETYWVSSTGQEASPVKTEKFRYQEVIVTGEHAANNIVEGLKNLYTKKKAFTVAEFYTLANRDYEYPDNTYGWNQSNLTYINKKAIGGDKFLIELPQPVPLNIR